MSNTKTCKYKGVTWCPRGKKYRARLGVGGKKIDLGGFNSAEKARDVYRKARKKLDKDRKKALEEFTTPKKLSIREEAFPLPKLTAKEYEELGHLTQVNIMRKELGLPLIQEDKKRNCLMCGNSFISKEEARRCTSCKRSHINQETIINGHSTITN